MRDDDQEPEEAEEGTDREDEAPVRIVSVYDSRPKGYEGTCLRPLGLCELGGSCDSCWYGPDHPRHREKTDG